MYRMRDLIDSGATISFGSDWPVSSSNPILGIATAVTRQTAELEPEGGWVPAQAITVAEAISCYSSAVSFQLTGTSTQPLDVGQPCDFVVLNKNPFETEPSELRRISVLATYKMAEKIHF
jgi:predicted amidohydrolase YtcJ